jgi:hypothetical protein
VSPHPDVPVLLVVGGMDPITPPAWSAEEAALFPKSRVLEIPGLGHVPVGLDHLECLVEMLASFYDSGHTEAVDTACVARMTRPAFVVQP